MYTGRRGTTHKDEAMRHWLPILCALLIGGCADSGVPAMYRSLAREDASIDATAARDLINQHRRQAGLAPLALDPALTAAAAAHAGDMASHDRVGHDISNGALADRLAAQGIDFAAAAENVGAGYRTIADAVSGWRGSPPHNANMLRAEARRMGIAASYAPASKYKLFWSLIVADGG
jgi:uncharacterized protein YkwD